MDPKASTSSGRKKKRTESQDVDPSEFPATPIVASACSTTPVVQGGQNVQISFQSTDVTSFRHLKKCQQFVEKIRSSQSTFINFRPIAVVAPSKGSQIVSTKFDMRRMREAATHWIMMHGHPFNIVEEEGFNIMQRRGMPEWKPISKQTEKNDCLLVYETEKKKLKNVLANVAKISLTTDLWKSKTQKIGYMVVTGHWIDSDWKLQKRILNFVNIPPPHTGREIAATLFECAKEWKIESKVYAISVDNASSNDLAITIMKEYFSNYSKLMCDGKIFHVRCCAHILNLLVQDGLGEIRDIVDKIRDTVDYINRSEARVIIFSECAAERNLIGPGKKLINDCKTRWNSTFDMLRCAYDFRVVFPRFKEQDPRYIYCPSVEDWEKVGKVCKVLEYFKSATLLVSGTDYPTANLFLKEMVCIKKMLDEKVYDSDDFIVRMVEKMKIKFDKYWGEVNLLMAIATVLDPTKKLISVEYYYEVMVGEDVANQYVSEVRNVLYKLYDKYASAESLHGKDPASPSHASSSTPRSKFSRDTDAGLEDFVRRRFGTRSQINELDDYLAKPPETKSDKDESLEWWKVNRVTYKVLSQMARDILAIPLNTVASEAAFSAGTRVIDAYRGSLAPETVQALMCGGDWLRKFYGVKN